MQRSGSLLARSAGWAGVFLLAVARPAPPQDLPEDFDATFAMSSVNPLLRVGADAIMRLDLLRFEVHDPGKATQTVRRAVTVLGPNGREEGELRIFYDGRLRELKRLNGEIRDSVGRVIRELEKEDQQDYSAVSDHSLYEETRVRVARLYHHAYPYTVEFEYEIRYDGLISWPTWYPQEEGMAVVYGRFDLVTPADAEVRYLVRGATIEPVTSQRGKRKTLTWEVRDELAMTIEPFGPAWQDQVIAVHTAPATFEIEGTRGDMRSWQTFGHWYHVLNEGRTVLPPDARGEVRRLTSGIVDDREKVQQLYAYLQERTRYVSIQLGLGGWQSFDAAYVHDRGYGDCKALTTYMRALLEQAGIQSFPALIRSGGRAPEVLTDFPSNQFDHVVLYAELADGEGIWLENTSQTVPFGHLGTFTEDRYALLIRPDRSELVRTPRSKAHDNQQVRRAEVNVMESGDATVQVRTRYTGNQQDGIRQRLANRSDRERTEWLVNNIDLPSFELVSVDFTEVDAGALTLTLPVTLEVSHFASRSGTRLFLPVNVFERWTYVPPPDEDRTQPIHFFPYAFADADTIRFTLPAGFTIEAMPDPVDVETPFGRYAATVAAGPDGTLTYSRQLEITEATFAPELYPAFRDFMAQIVRTDRAQVVLVAH